jgi:ubiquinone/menaquinone biosynthesis C-methylase UbiE
MRKTLWLFGLLALWNPSGLTFAQTGTTPTETGAPETQESIKPGINKVFLDPDLDVDDFVEKFEVESREVFAHRGKIVELLDLELGQSVADIGAGTGAFLETLLKAIGDDGKVYPVDISPAMCEHLTARAKKNRWPQVTVVRCDERNTLLEPNSVDAIMCCDTYHHFEFPAETLASIYRALKPGGIFLVIDFERIPGESREWTLTHVRAGKQTVIEEITAAGFELVAQPSIAGVEENYILKLTKSSSKK